MEELAKNLWVQAGFVGLFIGFLLLLHWDNRKKIEAQRLEFVAALREKETSHAAQMKDKDAVITALNERYLVASIERVKLTTEAIVTFATSIGKLTDEVRELTLLLKTRGP